MFFIGLISKTHHIDKNNYEIIIEISRNKFRKFNMVINRINRYKIGMPVIVYYDENTHNYVLKNVNDLL